MCFVQVFVLLLLLPFAICIYLGLRVYGRGLGFRVCGFGSRVGGGGFRCQNGGHIFLPNRSNKCGTQCRHFLLKG